MVKGPRGPKGIAVYTLHVSRKGLFLQNISERRDKGTFTKKTNQGLLTNVIKSMRIYLQLFHRSLLSDLLKAV